MERVSDERLTAWATGEMHPPEAQTMARELLDLRPRETARPDDLRALGWSVAVHNDYRLNDEPHTFWLLTKGGRAVKGEGKTDAEALNAIRSALKEATEGQPAALGPAPAAGALGAARRRWRDLTDAERAERRTQAMSPPTPPKETP